MEHYSSTEKHHSTHRSHSSGRRRSRKERRDGRLSRLDRRTQKWIIGLAVLVVLAGGAAACWIAADRLEEKFNVAPEGAGTAASMTANGGAANTAETISPGDDDGASAATLYYNGRMYALNEDITTLLIIGVDDFEIETSDTGRNTSQADFMTLVVIDNDEKLYTLLQLNRDTMTDVPMLNLFGEYFGTAYQQLALAHTYGNGLEESCENTVNAVSSLLCNIPIDNYIALTMNAVPILNDLAGGVTLRVLDDFTGVDDTLVMGTTVTLMGDHALTFVRARQDMVESGSNLRRMQRQRQYISALLEQLQARAETDPMFYQQAYFSVNDYIVSDCSLETWLSYSRLLEGCELAGIVTPEGEAVAGDDYMEFYVDESALRELVISLFFTETDTQ